MKSFFFLVLASVLLLLGKCAFADDIELSDFYIRLVPPEVEVTAAFGYIRANNDDALVAVRADISRATELHESSMNDAVMVMRRIKKIELPANTKVQLKPGGLHIMFIGLKKSVQESQVIDVKFEFRSGKVRRVKIPVRRQKASDSHNTHSY